MRNWASWDYLGCALVRLGSVLGHTVKGSWRRPRAILVRVKEVCGSLGEFLERLGGVLGYLGWQCFTRLGKLFDLFFKTLEII